MATKAYINNSFNRILVYANVFIAICAFAQVFMTYFLFHLPFNFNTISYLAFVTLSTFLQYNMQRGHMLFAQFFQRIAIYMKHKVWVPHETSPEINTSERLQWLDKNRKVFLASNLISLLALFFLCNWLSWTSIYIMIGAEVVSTLYYMQPFNLRRFGYIKPFLISAIWAISCVLVPLLEFGKLNDESVYFLIAKFLFIAELCVVFDINDSDKDFREGVYTYANKLGLTFTKIFCIVLLAGSGIMYGLFIKETTPIIFAAVFLSLCAVLSLLAYNEKHAFYYYLVIDGLMLIQPLFYLAPILL